MSENIEERDTGIEETEKKKTEAFTQRVESETKGKISSLLRDLGLSGVEFGDAVYEMLVARKASGDKEAKTYMADLETINMNVKQIYRSYVSMIDKFQVRMQDANLDRAELQEKLDQIVAENRENVLKRQEEIDSLKSLLKSYKEENTALQREKATIEDSARKSDELLKSKEQLLEQANNRILEFVAREDGIKEYLSEKESFVRKIEQLENTVEYLRIEHQRSLERAEEEKNMAIREAKIEARTQALEEEQERGRRSIKELSEENQQTQAAIRQEMKEFYQTQVEERAAEWKIEKTRLEKKIQELERKNLPKDKK
ncbi:hypothetical protein [Aneurinibacillus tyrosinisolvens]|uniref:hypothetical protein n=1 Tax=Aneurinibacillus tyrosinisolvens TaxID=1443435 RepID=UPI00063FBEB7|nr:hypothetical protein [Aneurinibacillus tyrosinisolvens]